MGFPGGWEWFVILLIALLIFGSRLPSVMRSLGSSINEFKRGMNEEAKDEEKELAEAREVGPEQDEEEAEAPAPDEEEAEQAEQHDHVTA
jgi:sec-independent protein translocase protein TatA